MASFDLTYNNESKITIKPEQKSAISAGIIWGTLTIMKQTIERETPKQCAAHDSKPFRQSKTAMTDNTISISILTGDQKPHARPRDFRTVLSDEEKNIGNPELSDVLASLCRRLILEHSENNFSNPRGRPISQSNLNDETRGRKSYYDASRVKQIIDQVLNDQESFRKIDNAVTSSDIYFKHKKYCIEVGIHQMRTNEKEFLNSYKPVFKKHGLKQLPDDAYIKKENITDDLITTIATRLAQNTKSTESERRAAYTYGGIIYFDQVMRKYRQST